MSHVERVIGYARVSVSGEDINNQIKAIEEYCRSRGYELLTILKDTVTGVTNPFDRPAFHKLLVYIHDLGIRKIVVYDISRLGRSLAEIYNVLRILMENDVVVEFARHPELSNMDKNSFSVFITAFGLASQLEREFMKQRLETARRSGKRIGRPPIEIPVEEVKRLLKMGLSKKDVYNLLVGKGYLRKKDGTPITYIQFLRRLKILLRR